MAADNYNTRLEAALAELALQDAPNYLGTSTRHNVSHTTLRERFLGNRQSRKEAIAKYH